MDGGIGLIIYLWSEWSKRRGEGRRRYRSSRTLNFEKKRRRTIYKNRVRLLNYEHQLYIIFLFIMWIMNVNFTVSWYFYSTMTFSSKLYINITKLKKNLRFNLLSFLLLMSISNYVHIIPLPIISKNIYICTYYSNFVTLKQKYWESKLFPLFSSPPLPLSPSR